MSLNITNLFEDLGELVEVINAFDTLAVTTLPGYESAIRTEFDANGMYDMSSRLPRLFGAFQSQVSGWQTSLNSVCISRLTDLTTVRLELPVGDNFGVRSVLEALYRYMVDEEESLDGSDITVGAVSSALLSDSDGTLLVTDILDGVSQPVGGGPANPLYALDLTNAVGSGRLPGEHADYVGTYSELAVTTETVTVACIRDSGAGNATEGREIFEVKGEKKHASPWSWNPEGSGNGPQIMVLNGYTYVTNGEFESWASSAPSGWTLDSGIAGTDILEETTSIKRGDSALEMQTPTRAITAVSVANPTVLSCTGHGLAVGDEIFLAGFTTTPDINGAQTVNTVPTDDTFTLDINVTDNTDGVGTWKFDELQISQAVSGLVPGKRYCVACWVKGDATIASGALTIQMEGTGYVAGTVEKISMDDTALAAQTSYGLEYFYFNAPWEIPSDFELVLKITGTLTDSAIVYVDGLALGPVVYHGGVGLAVIAGDEAFLQGDQFSFALSNDGAGTFQEYFRKAHKYQLPSDLSGTETIADSLAEA